MIAWSILRVQAGNALVEPIRENPSDGRPVIYTYFERIDATNRTTGMSDEEDNDLLMFWKERWQEAGYVPIILTSNDANLSHLSMHSQNQSFTKERYESVRSKLDSLPLDDFGSILFRRWLAMAVVGGGWYSDYDNFPLWGEELPKMPARLNLYDILSPTLASGSGVEWLDTLEALLEDASEHCSHISKGRQELNCFYTDSLATNSLRANRHSLSPKTARKVAVPFDKNDPVSFDDPSLCSSKDFRSKYTIHFGPEALQRGRHVPPNDRLPKYRVKLARDWLNRWKELCGKSNDQLVEGRDR